MSVNVKLGLWLINQSPNREDVQGSRSTAPRIFNVGSTGAHRGVGAARLQSPPHPAAMGILEEHRFLQTG
jgi:hypothetical protein